jgi:hypothetical protein
MAAKQPEDLLLGNCVTQSSCFPPGHRDGSNGFERELGESKEI